jgi:hypothetical protein
MNRRRSISIVTSEAIVRSALLLMARDAKAHRVIHSSLGHCHLRDIAVACRALDARANVRRMIEAHMCFFEKSVNALPRDFFLALRVIAQSLNAGVLRIADIFMTTHTHIDARNSGARPGSHTGMTFMAFDADFVEGVNLVRKIDGLLRLGLDA